MTYTVGGQAFATKDQVRSHASEVLNRSVIGVALDGADDRFARDLLACHPDASRKLGVGVEAVVVIVVPEWGTRNFLVIREDGSTDNWSIKKCVANMRPDGAKEAPMLA